MEALAGQGATMRATMEVMDGWSNVYLGRAAAADLIVISWHVYHQPQSGFASDSNYSQNFHRDR